MKNPAKLMQLFLIITLMLLAVAGCKKQNTEQRSEEATNVRYAKELYQRIKNYDKWPQPEGFKGWQKGTSPHGSTLKYYYNLVAQESLEKTGAVIVKENYSDPNDDALMSITIMEKRAGYDPETKNWFYAKYSPEGEVMENPQGKKLAGLVGKGSDKGCLPCHSTAGGGDYLFMND